MGVAQPGDVSLELPVPYCYHEARDYLRMKQCREKARHETVTKRSLLTFFEHLNLVMSKARTIHEFFSYLNK